MTGLFAEIYRRLPDTKGKFDHAFEYSLGNAIPFYTSSRSIATEAKISLFGSESSSVPVHLAEITIFQSFLSGILLFLIGLALRNIFRS